MITIRSFKSSSLKWLVQYQNNFTGMSSITLILNCSNCSAPLVKMATKATNRKFLNPFPHIIDAFWFLCSRQLFENIVTKEEIAQNKQFLLLTKCFPLLVIGYPFNYRDFLFFDMFEVVCCRIAVWGKGLKGIS